MSLCIGLVKTLSNSLLVTGAVVGYGSGFDFTKTLLVALALGTRNCTFLPNPSACNDSVARSYSASAIVRDNLFPYLGALYVTAGPGDKKMLSWTESLVGCSLVLSQIELVIFFKELEENKRACKKRVELGSETSRSVLQRVRYLSNSVPTDYCDCFTVTSFHGHFAPCPSMVRSRCSDKRVRNPSLGALFTKLGKMRLISVICCLKINFCCFT